MSAQRREIAASFAFRCRSVVQWAHLVVDTNQDRGPFVAEWGIGGLRIRLVCGVQHAAVRIFADVLSVDAVEALASSLRAIGRVMRFFHAEDCGGTPAEFAAALQDETPLGKEG